MILGEDLHFQVAVLLHQLCPGSGKSAFGPLGANLGFQLPVNEQLHDIAFVVVIGHVANAQRCPFGLPGVLFGVAWHFRAEQGIHPFPRAKFVEFVDFFERNTKWQVNRVFSFHGSGLFFFIFTISGEVKGTSMELST